MIRELRFNHLCRRYSDDVYRYAWSLLRNEADAEDAAQEVLLRLWKHLPNIQYTRARSWILKTTRHYCLDQIRRRTTQSALVLDEETGAFDRADDSVKDPRFAADARNLQQDLEISLLALPETLRSVFVLYEVNGLRYREIADTLEIPINSVKVYLSRARQKLQESLAAYESWINASKS